MKPGFYYNFVNDMLYISYPDGQFFIISHTGHLSVSVWKTSDEGFEKHFEFIGDL